MENKERCFQNVTPNERWGAFHSHQCSKTAVVTRDGKSYCKIHDPEYIKVKGKKRTEIWKKKFDLEIAGIIASRQCVGINSENPRAVAESIGDMYEALKGMLEGSEIDPTDPDRVWERACPSSDAVIKGSKALAKADSSPVS